MECPYPSKERRCSSPTERQIWKDSHPRGVVTVALIFLILGTISQLVYAAADPKNEFIALIRDAFFTVFGSAAVIYVGQRLFVFCMNHLQLRMEKVNAMPERLDKFEELVKTCFAELRLELKARDDVQDTRIDGLEKRIELLKG